MNNRIRSGLTLIIVISIALIASVTYRQAYSEDLVAHPGNLRPVLNQYKIERGEIFATDGAVLAANEKGDAGYKRVYPKGEPFSPVIGYFDPVRGRSGLEASGEKWLGGQRERGADLTLTIDPGLQKTAYDLLSGRRGAIVVIDPSTGAVLAMASRPSFDPADLGSDWSPDDSGEGSLLNRAIQSAYPPGSTFKIITASAALESGLATPATVYNGPASLRVYGSKVTNYGGRSFGRVPLEYAFTRSINTVFARIGLDLGPERLVGSAGDFGFGSQPPFDLPVRTSTMASAATMDKVMLAWTAVGQGETLATPLEMALVAGGIANKGVIYEPYLVEYARDYNGAVLYHHRPRVWRRPIDAETARTVKNMMVDTVREGTGRAATVEGVTVAGKTGTAEVGGGKDPHAWFVSFAPAEEPELAVAVIVENGGTGGTGAAPLARAVIEERLRGRP